MNRETPANAETAPEDMSPGAPKTRDQAVTGSRAGGPVKAQGAKCGAGSGGDARRDPSDVRAGPGDAGGQRSPRVAPRAPDGRARPGGRALAIVVGITLGIAALVALGSLL